MLICKFSGKLVNIATLTSSLDTLSLSRYCVTFALLSFVFFPLDEKKEKWITVLRGGNFLLPFHCWNIEKRVVLDKITPLSPSILAGHLSLIVSPFVSEHFSSLYETARECYLFFEDWEGIIFASKEDETEEDLYEIGIAYLSLDKNE